MSKHTVQIEETVGGEDYAEINLAPGAHQRINITRDDRPDATIVVTALEDTS